VTFAEEAWQLDKQGLARDGRFISWADGGKRATQSDNHDADDEPGGEREVASQRVDSLGDY
jgi:hypothetical protein